MKEYTPKIHLYISGGCGNQFFQYAFARSVQEAVGGELIINYNLIRKYKQSNEGNDNLLKDFTVKDYVYENRTDFGYLIFEALRFVRGIFRLKDFQKKTYEFYLKCARRLPQRGIYYFDAAYYPFRITRRRNIYIRGYFESAAYFKAIDEKIKRELCPKHALLAQNQEFYDRIVSSESVCITIKRQDVDNEKISDIYDYSLAYFYKAIEYIESRVENPVFFIFSDNVEWCRKNLKIEHEVYFEKDNNPIWEKIRLMSSCRHFIIHNSTFSWWVQHLSPNPDRIVIAPSRWMYRDDQPIDIYEEGWVYINNKNEIVKEHE